MIVSGWMKLDRRKVANLYTIGETETHSKLVNYDLLTYQDRHSMTGDVVSRMPNDFPSCHQLLTFHAVW